MAAYAIRRLLWTLPVLFFIAVVTFALMHLVPGGPWDAAGRPVSDTLEQQLRAKYGLDESVWRQFLTFLWNLLQGDLGISYRLGRPVTAAILEGLEVSAVLGLLALAFAVVVGIPLGVLAALNRNRGFDFAAIAFSTAGASVPSYILGILLIVVFSVWLDLLPVFGWKQAWWIVPEWKYAVLPTITLGALPAALLAQVTRASVIEVLDQDYIRTARAKGIAEQRIVLRHVVKNAMVPVLTVIGPLAAALVTGSFIVETVFGIPGVGKQFVTAIFQRDYGMIMGTTLFYAAVVAIANLLVDISYGVVDPRIRR